MGLTSSNVSDQKQENSNEKRWLKWRHGRHKIKTKKLGKQKDTRKKERAYKASMLLKYWKATTEEPIRDLCMVIAMYMQDIEAGLLYGVGYAAAITTKNGIFKDIDTLSRIKLWDKGKETVVKGVMNGNDRFHAFFFENGTIRVIDTITFDIRLELEIIAINSGNRCNSLSIIDANMHVYEIKSREAVRITGLPNGLEIKDISCGYESVMLLSECGRVFGMGSNQYGKLGLLRRIPKAEIPTEITFSNQNDSDKNEVIITMIHASYNGWVAMSSKQQAWIVGEYLMKSLCSDFVSLDPCIGIVEMWYSNKVQIAQIKCGWYHVIALDTNGRVYWFGKFDLFGSLSHVSLDPIPFQHRITEIRSGFNSVACKDTTNEWYIWGMNSVNHITGLCGCESACREATNYAIISNPMRCEWQGLFDASRVIDLQLGWHKAHVIVDLF